jgi:hypothetical protein
VAVEPIKEASLRAALLATAAALVLVPATLAATMHPELGARLAGMGEHGVVNLQVRAKAGRLCWAFDLPTTTGATGASIHAVGRTAALVRLGRSYSRKGCTKADAMVLEHLESRPGTYWVFVDTKGHPGDLRGKLFAGMAHM